MSATPPSSLMVRLPNPLGDAVMALPLLSDIRRQFPKCRLTLAGNPTYQSLFSDLDHIDAYLPLDNSLSVMAQAKVLRQVECDTIILCPNSLSSAVAAKFANIKQRIGRRRHARQLFLTHSLPAIKEPRLMTELYCELIEAFGVTGKVTPVYLAAPEVDVEWAPPLETKYYMVAPGAAFGSSKQYPPHLMTKVLNGIYEKHRMLPLLFGAPNEQQSLRELSSKLDHDSIVAASGADFSEIKYVMSQASFVLCMDSGARHIAAAVGVPQLSIFGPTDLRWTAHATEKLSVITNDKLDCLGCHYKSCPLPNHPCMTELDPQIIIDESSRLNF